MPRLPSAQTLPPALSGGFWGTPRPTERHRLPSQSWVFLTASSWNISLGRCPGGIRDRCPSYLSWLLSVRLSFSPCLYGSAQPPWGGSSFRLLVASILSFRLLPTVHDHWWKWECRLTLIRGFRLSTRLCLHRSFPVRRPHNCGGSSSALLFSQKRCRKCLSGVRDVWASLLRLLNFATWPRRSGWRPDVIDQFQHLFNSTLTMKRTDKAWLDVAVLIHLEKSLINPDKHLLFIEWIHTASYCQALLHLLYGEILKAGMLS